MAVFPVHRAVAGALVGAATATFGVGATWLLTLAWLSARARVVAPGPAAGDEALALAAATVAVAIAAWLCVSVLLEVLSHAPGRVGRAADRWADRFTPALARRAAVFVLGVGVGVAAGPPTAVAGARSAVGAAVDASNAAPSDVVAAAATPAAPAAAAAPADPGFGALATSTGSVGDAPDPGFAPAPASPGFAPSAVAPGFTPAAPRVRPQADAGLLGSRPRFPAATEVVVHRGDSLWSIAARHLGPDASDTEVARAWPQWYAANRDRIGDDPDLILPGQILRVPGPDQTGSVTR